MNHLEKELFEARKIYIEAIDNGDEKTEQEFADIIDQLAKMINHTSQANSYSQWHSGTEHERENLECPKEIIEEVREFADGAPAGFNKSKVDEWNEFLPFDLHAKLKTYGMVGAARLNKIFKL